MQLHPAARVLIISQAPGRRAHVTGLPWNDDSGNRLRAWLGLDETVFYDAAQVAIMPMGFCYPGVAATGGDAPPSPACAPQWHARILAALPNIRLKILVGMYAQKQYLPAPRPPTLTQAVRNARTYLPHFFPVPHPSWRSVTWMRRHPWFEKETVPAAQEAVSKAISKK